MAATPSMDSILTTFGKTLRALRKQQGLSQEELAHLSGIHRNYVSDVERGRRNIALKNIVALAKALKVKPGRLLDGL